METEFAACLLMVGPPDVLFRRGVMSYPVSSMTYMRKCEVWWRNHVYEYGMDCFGQWWIAYKAWLMEHWDRHEQN